jgi:signal transduction histidine kinase/ActR/RegA family two-component response regulator
MSQHSDYSPAHSQESATSDHGIRDLMGLLALPALWAGRDGETVLRLMVEAAERIVPLGFSYAQVLLVENPSFKNLLRVEGRYCQGEALSQWEVTAETWKNMRVPDGRAYEANTPLGCMHIVHLSMGFGTYGGKIWFGSAAPGFPTVNQLALLRAAASLAATGLQAARANFEREQASRAKDEFLAMLGHELRNPLSPIVMALGLIKKRHQDFFPRELQIIERQADHLSRLVDDLLDITRITRGKIDIKKEPVELKRVLTQALENTSVLIQERRQQIINVFPIEEVWVSGDAIRLIQVFTNLITNAAKYTQTEGQITVELQVDLGQVHVMVGDNGSGISPQLLPRIFNIFEQGAVTIDRAKGGLGIGLALVKSFVALHSGTVTASSDGLGCGSTFTVMLPRLTSAVTKTPQVLTFENTSVKPARVLLVDDNLDALESTQAVLRQYGHIVEATSNSYEVMELTHKFRPNLAVLDIGLPGLDGYELAAQLRAHYSASTLGLIALTGYGQAKDRARSKAAGFDMHLVKPVSLNDLMTAIAHISSKQSALSVK